MSVVFSLLHVLALVVLIGVLLLAIAIGLRILFAKLERHITTEDLRKACVAHLRGLKWKAENDSTITDEQRQGIDLAIKALVRDTQSQAIEEWRREMEKQ